MALGKLKSKPAKSAKDPKEDEKEIGQQVEDDVMFRRVHRDEGVHAPDELISSADELFGAVAPMWKGGLFDKNIMNGGTGRGFTNSYHKKGAGAKNKRDFIDLTFAFCLEPIEVMYHVVVYRCRCLSQFCVKSDQCIVHSKTVHKDGPNSIYTDMLAGRSVSWSRIDMEAAPMVAAPLTTEQQKAAIKKKLEELDVEYEELREDQDVVEKLDETRNWLNKLSKAMSKTATSD